MEGRCAMKLDEMEVKIYKFINEVIDTFMINYNYKLVCGNVYTDKYYERNNNEIIVTNTNNDKINTVELIGLGYDILNMLTDSETELNINSNELSEMLNVVCFNTNIIEDGNELKWEYVYNDIILGRGSKNSFTLDLEKFVKVVKDNVNEELFNDVLDVNVKCVSEEEMLNGLIFANNLRVNDIKTVINSKDNSKMTLLIKEDNLNKGLIEVIDNSTNESALVDEAEIVDYILGVI